MTATVAAAINQLILSTLVRSAVSAVTDIVTAQKSEEAAVEAVAAAAEAAVEDAVEAAVTPKKMQPSTKPFPTSASPRETKWRICFQPVYDSSPRARRGGRSE
jgi:hypothetical protein